MSDTYKLRVSVTIERHSNNSGWTGDRLNVSEDTEVDASTFLEAANILGQFHALTETIKAKP